MTYMKNEIMYQKSSMPIEYLTLIIGAIIIFILWCLMRMNILNLVESSNAPLSTIATMLATIMSIFMTIFIFFLSYSHGTMPTEYIEKFINKKFIYGFLISYILSILLVTLFLSGITINTENINNPNRDLNISTLYFSNHGYYIEDIPLFQISPNSLGFLILLWDLTFFLSYIYFIIPRISRFDKIKFLTEFFPKSYKLQIDYGKELKTFNAYIENLINEKKDINDLIKFIGDRHVEYIDEDIGVDRIGEDGLLD